MCVNVCTDMCVNVCADTGLDVRMDKYGHMCRHMYGHSRAVPCHDVWLFLGMHDTCLTVNVRLWHFCFLEILQPGPISFSATAAPTNSLRSSRAARRASSTTAMTTNLDQHRRLRPSTGKRQQRPQLELQRRREGCVRACASYARVWLGRFAAQATRRAASTAMQRSVRRTSLSWWFLLSISEHANGDHRGACADLKVPRGASYRDLFRRYRRIRHTPSAFAVGMLRTERSSSWLNNQFWLGRGAGVVVMIWNDPQKAITNMPL